MKVAASVVGWKYQEEKYSHFFIGFLDEADGGQGRSRGGGFSAVLDEEVGVVTVFKRHLSRGERERAGLGAALREDVL